VSLGIVLWINNNHRCAILDHLLVFKPKLFILVLWELCILICFGIILRGLHLINWCLQVSTTRIRLIASDIGLTIVHQLIESAACSTAYSHNLHLSCSQSGRVFTLNQTTWGPMSLTITRLRLRNAVLIGISSTESSVC
jgi:hypothetical protein